MPGVRPVRPRQVLASLQYFSGSFERQVTNEISPSPMIIRHTVCPFSNPFPCALKYRTYIHFTNACPLYPQLYSNLFPLVYSSSLREYSNGISQVFRVANNLLASTCWCGARPTLKKLILGQRIDGCATYRRFLSLHQ